MSKLTFKQKRAFLIFPFEIYNGEERIAIINCDSYLGGRYSICFSKNHWEAKLTGIFTPEIILTDNYREIGRCKFNFWRNKGILRLSSGFEYRFVNQFSIFFRNSSWIVPDGSKPVSFVRKIRFFQEKGDISVDDAWVSQDRDLLVNLGVLIIALQGMWSNSSG